MVQEGRTLVSMASSHYVDLNSMQIKKEGGLWFFILGLDHGMMKRKEVYGYLLYTEGIELSSSGHE